MPAVVQGLESRFAQYVQSGGLVRRGDSVLLAVSGGVDSMVMLRLFLAVLKEWDLKLGVVHVNHRLRGAESDGDEEFVRQTALGHALPCSVTRVDTLGYAHANRLSKQQAARELRYKYFEEVRSHSGMTSVATAHQADDNAEAVLLNVLRGTGIRGLTGIPPRREPGSVIRPLLFAGRGEIEEFARKHEITFRTDSSNESPEYRRNYLRRTLMPLLSGEVHPDIVGALNRLSGLMRQLDEKLTLHIEARWREIVQVDERGRWTLIIPHLLAQPPFLQEEILVRFLRSLGHDVDSTTVGTLVELCSHPTGRSTKLARSVSAYRDRDRLVFVAPPVPGLVDTRVTVGERYRFEGFEFSLSGPLPKPERFGSDGRTEYVDSELLGDHLVLRGWKEGDWFVPLGMVTRKKLSDFFTDEKIPLFEKTTIPILESKGEIVWVCGKRLDDRFKVTPQTRSVIKLEFVPLLTIH